MYDRTVHPIPEPTTSGLRYRLETLVGITGVKMAKYRSSLSVAFMSPLNVVWRPHLMGILWFEVGLFYSNYVRLESSHLQALLFGFSIGMYTCVA